MKYLVTGATGFMGGRAARQLLAAGHEVVRLGGGLPETLEYKMQQPGMRPKGA